MVETKKEPRERIELPAIDVERLLAGAPALVIDLRSPAEFAQDHVPGAHNLPLFDDVERALVGTLYRQSSPAAAFEEGWRYVRAHVAELVEGIAALASWPISTRGIEADVDALCAGGVDGLAATLVEKKASELPPGAVVFHCWRGGLRSRSVVALLQKLGFERALLLSGGYKAYRGETVRAIDAWRAPPVFVLRGWTGVGKTLVLRAIEELRPGTTIDLEALAGHRSSLLGMIGLEPCSQKTFESRLFARLRVIESDRWRAHGVHEPGQLREFERTASFSETGIAGALGVISRRSLARDEPPSHVEGVAHDLLLGETRGEHSATQARALAYGPRSSRSVAAAGSLAPIVFEGESRKVGDVILPANVWRALAGGTNLELSTSLERRIEVLKQDYLASTGARCDIARQLPLIEARMKLEPGCPGLCALLESGAVDELVRILLERYYDPLYRHSEQGRQYAARFDATEPVRAAREIVDWIDAASASNSAS